MGAKGKQLAWLHRLDSYPEMVALIGEYDDDEDYLGPAGSWKVKLVPRTIWGVDINVCGFIHDANYAKRGNSEDRFSYDCIFLCDILRQIEMCIPGWYNMPRRHLARLRAMKYHSMVRKFGVKYF